MFAFPWIKATKKDIKNLISNHTFLVQYPRKGKPVTPCMDVYKEQVKSDGSLDKLKLIIVVSLDLQIKELVGDTWSPIASTRILKYFLKNVATYKARVHQIYFIGAFLQAKVKNRVSVKLNRRYADYLP